MKTAVIICEFNPLHSGHKRLIDFAKTFADKVICVMSGNFVQRGAPAVCNKYKRAMHALKAGADLVVELPTVFAVSSAENFALGGVKIANALNADYLVFGSESGNLQQLRHCAQLLDEPQINAQIRLHLAEGVTYPKAVGMAVGMDILTPNNILAIEYLRALKTTNSTIEPVTLQRENNMNSAPQQYASSTALRQQPQLRSSYTYDFVATDIDDSLEQQYREFALRFLATAEKDYLANIAGVTEGLHNRIFAASKTDGYDNMMQQIKTKRYTMAKLQRIVLCCVLGITKQTEQQFKQQSFVQDNKAMVKVLGVKDNATQLLENLTNTTDEVTLRADRLYQTFDKTPAPTKLQKLQ